MKDFGSHEMFFFVQQMFGNVMNGRGYESRGSTTGKLFSNERALLRCVFVVAVAVAFLNANHSWGQALPAKVGVARTVSASDFQSAVLWVKLKKQHAGILSARNGRVASLPGVSIAHPLLPIVQQASGRRGPVNQHVDISLYHTLVLEQGVSLATVMSSLNATGYFDAVEQVVINRPFGLPNDPSLGLQPYLDVIKAPAAWDITTGDERIVIGIVDTGGDLDHPDLVGKLFVDPAEPVDGIDNDGDGYVDNNRGWDFSGDVASAVGTPGFQGDNDPSVPKAGLFGHGTMVAGCAAASTDNGVGIASVGRGARLLFTKHFSDDQDANAANYSSNTYLGVLYAATHGAKIINCSWGSYNPSTIAQDIINYVTLDLGCLVIAAAGNSNLETPIYPASYDNVVSVGATTLTDERTFFSNYGRTLDLVAPGADLYTTQFNDGYVYESGTSLSAPIVSGAAALVWSVHPEFTAMQVAEQLRVSSDPSIYAKNPAFQNKLGHGRLDVLAALTTESSSVRVDNQQLWGEDNGSPAPGQTVSLVMDFTNYLAPASPALSAIVSTTSPYATVVNGSYAIGPLGTGEKRRNVDVPFQLALSPGLPLDEVIEILVTIADNGYEDHHLINISIPSYIDIKENNVITSLAANGRIGYGAPESQSNGSGFLYNEEHLLFEMGVVMGASETALYNNVRSAGGAWDEDFVPQGKLRKETPGNRSYSEVTGKMVSGDDQLEVAYNSMVWNEDPDKNFVILEYTVKNNGGTDVNDFYVGLFADWDIADQGAHDRAGWDSDTRLGYVYPQSGLQMPRTGIQALTGEPQYHAIDNDPAVPGNPFGLYDGFSDSEKFGSISSGVARTEAGSAGTGSDVSHVVGSGPYLIPAGESVTIAFALHAAMNQADLIKSAQRADTVYNYMLKAPVPVIGETVTCVNMPTILTPTGAAQFSLYKTAIGGQAVSTGPTLAIGPISHDSVVYIANADQPYESLRTPATITVVSRPVVDARGAVVFCAGDSVYLETGVSDGYEWSNGETTRTISVKSQGTYSVKANRNGVWCPSNNSQKVTVNPLPSATFTTNPETLYADRPITFTADETEAASWQWQIDGEVAGEGSTFEYTFPEEGVFAVSLTVIDKNQCIASSSGELGLVTGIESLMAGTAIYPNPVIGDILRITLPAGAAEVFLEVVDMKGHQLLTRFGRGEELSELPTEKLRNGIYILRIRLNGQAISQKFTIAR